MTKIALRTAAVVACATALMQLPLGAAAGPVDLGKFIVGVRFGYSTAVQINIADSSDTPQGVEIREIELQDIKDQGRTHRIAVQDGSISEADTEGAVDWLIAGFPAERGYQALLAVADLESDAHPADPNVLKATLAALGLEPVTIRKNVVGLFTSSGEQKGVLGDQASVAELLASLEGIAAADAAEQSSDGESVEKIATDHMAETGTLASTEFNAFLGELMTELPSRSGKPPLVSATDPVIPQLRQGLTHGVLTRVTSEIAQRVAEREGKIKGVKDGQLLVQDVTDAFKAAGVDDVRVSYTTEKRNFVRGTEKGNLLITSGAHVVADAVTAQKTKNGTWYLGSDAVNSLRVQLGGKLSAALEPALDQRGVTGDLPSLEKDVDAAVSDIERDMSGEPGKKGPETPPDPNGGGESGDSNGEKK
jgi:hypothetical protein